MSNNSKNRIKTVGANRMLALTLSVLAIVSLSSCQKELPVLSNKNASMQTVRVYEYLQSAEGKYTLSAQQESTWMDSENYELDYIYEATGKYPAMRGLDYMNDDFEGVNKRAYDWWQKGGLVTICWHTGTAFTGAWAEAQSEEIADWDLMFTDGTAENKAMLDGMDKAAKALKELQDKGVTVIWRPFHEFDGVWFWWGKGGAENFKKLWRTMYERYTDYWQLDNLIWVLGYSHNGEDYKDWYVGDEYCDIVGADSYDKEEFKGLFKEVKKINKSGKPVCLHECGSNPTTAELDENRWLWFMTWHTEYLIDTNTKEELNTLYNSEQVITLDELDFNK